MTTDNIDTLTAKQIDERVFEELRRAMGALSKVAYDLSFDLKWAADPTGTSQRSARQKIRTFQEQLRQIYFRLDMLDYLNKIDTAADNATRRFYDVATRRGHLRRLLKEIALLEQAMDTARTISTEDTK